METMRFYGWSWAEMMDTPISAFWVCHRHSNRIRAKETLHQMFLQSTEHMESADRKRLVEELQEEQGSTVVEKGSEFNVSNAMAQLKALQ